VGRHDAPVDSEGWDRRYSGTELVWTAEPNRFLAEEAGALRPGRALDLACGEGRNAVWLAEHGWDVVGIDYSRVGLEKGARLAQQRGVAVRWEVADLREWKPSPAAFDLIVVLYLHVTADERRAIHHAAAQALAPDGVLLIVGHDATNIEDGHGGPQNPAILFTPDDLVGDVRGLEIERAERVHRTVQTDHGAAVAIDALLRARKRAGD
jgi:SAM-dependent methyltransferase